MGNLIEKQFEKMGARARVREPGRPLQRSRFFGEMNASAVRLDIARDSRGEFYDVQFNPQQVSLEVVDVRPDQRHLLLMTRDLQSGAKEKFLCGHDERAWFVAAVPGRSVSTVATAFEALKPSEVRFEQRRKAVRTKDRTRRRNAAFVRQGEWFFVPVPHLTLPAVSVLRNEPLRRGNGKPHVAERCVRLGGQSVYVCSRHPNGLLEKDYRALVERDPTARLWGWRVMVRDAMVYVQGYVRHPDHATIRLAAWHRVLPNTESKAPAMRHVAFLD